MLHGIILEKLAVKFFSAICKYITNKTISALGTSQGLGSYAMYL